MTTTKMVRVIVDWEQKCETCWDELEAKLTEAGSPYADRSKIPTCGEEFEVPGNCVVVCLHDACDYILYPVPTIGDWYSFK